MRSVACSILLLALGTAGCVDDRNDPHAGPACTTPSGCGTISHPTTTGGEGGSGSGSGGAGVGGGSADVTGTVKLLADPAFLQTQVASYEGKATIVAEPAAMGQPVTAPYGEGEITFTLEGVPSGAAWMTVRDETDGATGVLSTMTLQTVPSATPIVLPVLERLTLENVAATLVGQPPIEDGKAHIAVALQRDGAPLEGVSVDGGSVFGGIVAYDEGTPGDYSNDVLATGAAGTILILDAEPPVGGKLVLNVVDDLGNVYPLDLRAAADTMVIAGFELP